MTKLTVISDFWTKSNLSYNLTFPPTQNLNFKLFQEMFRFALYEAQKLNENAQQSAPGHMIAGHVGAAASRGVAAHHQQPGIAPKAVPSAAAQSEVRQEKERLLRRALPDAQAAAANWIASTGMYGKPPSRFIRDITRILFDPGELASNRVTTLDKKWVSCICKEAIDAYPNHSHATSGAVRNIISTMCSEARVSLGYSKSKNQKKKMTSPSPESRVNPRSIQGHALVRKAIEASNMQQSCLN